MHIHRDERRIRILSDIGQYATLGGLLILLAGLIISFVKPGWFAPLLGSVIVGFLLSVVGGFFANRYAGPLAHHESLAEVLKGLDYRHVLFQYLLPASHVLLEPGGFTVFVVKPQAGHVTYEDGEWKHQQRWKFFRRIMGEEGLGSPHAEAESEVKKLRDYLDEHMADADDVPVRGAVVFVNPDVEVDAEGSPVPAFYRKKVKGWLRGLGKREDMPAGLRRRLEEILEAERREKEEG